MVNSFIEDSKDAKNSLLLNGKYLTDCIDKLDRNDDQDIEYYSHLKDFPVNSGQLCDDIYQAANNDVILLALIGARVLFEDLINISYIESLDSSKRMEVANDWFRISNDQNANKSKLNSKTVKERAEIAGTDILSIYNTEYAELCNYSHSTAQRAILNIPEHRAILAQKTILLSLQAYAGILSTISKIIDKTVNDRIEGTISQIFFKYKETVVEAKLQT
jgi:hypothetical protein